jgi:hypothetical protein
MTVGVALLLDLTSRLPRAGASAASAAAQSHPGLSAAAFAATAAAAFSSDGVPLSARHLFGFVPLPLSPLLHVLLGFFRCELATSPSRAWLLEHGCPCCGEVFDSLPSRL